jgi:hypothetical protein
MSVDAIAFEREVAELVKRGGATGGDGQPLSATVDAAVDRVYVDLPDVPRTICIAAVLACSQHVRTVPLLSLESRSILRNYSSMELTELLRVSSSADHHPDASSSRGTAQTPSSSSSSLLTATDNFDFDCERHQCRRRKQRIAELEQSLLGETLRSDQRVSELQASGSAALRRLELQLRAAEDLASTRLHSMNRIVKRFNAMHADATERGARFDAELSTLLQHVAGARNAQSRLDDEVSAKEARIAALEARVVMLSSDRAADAHGIVAQQAGRIRELERELDRCGVAAQLDKERELNGANLKMIALKSRLREMEARVVEGEARIEALQSGRGPGYVGGAVTARIQKAASDGAVWM